jgi:hypothetical protein
MDDPKPKRTPRAVWIFWTLFFLSLFFNLWLWQFFGQTRPTSPDPLHGRIYRIDDHGRVVYLNLAEYCAAFAHWILIILALPAVIVWKAMGAFAALFAKKPGKKADVQPPL